jgi:hypothetical protein
MTVAATVLLGRLLDLFLMVMPSLKGEVFGFWDVCLIPGGVALIALLMARNNPEAVTSTHAFEAR